MKLLVLLAVFSLDALADPVSNRRPDSRMFTCSDATALVQQNGAVVFQYGPNLFRRYVANSSFCQVDEVTEAAYAPTSDQVNCFVGYFCRTRPGR